MPVRWRSRQNTFQGLTRRLEEREKENDCGSATRMLREKSRGFESLLEVAFPASFRKRHSRESGNPGVEEWIPGRGLRPPYQVRGRLARNDDIRNPLRISGVRY
jgi:hypothetical protein